MNISRPIGYALVIIGLIIGIFGVSMMSVNEIGVLIGIFVVLIALVLVGIGAIAAKK